MNPITPQPMNGYGQPDPLQQLIALLQGFAFSSGATDSGASPFGTGGAAGVSPFGFGGFGATPSGGGAGSPSIGTPIGPGAPPSP